MLERLINERCISLPPMVVLSLVIQHLLSMLLKLVPITLLVVARRQLYLLLETVASIALSKLVSLGDFHIWVPFSKFFPEMV